MTLADARRVLCVEAGASKGAIRANYLKLQGALHPDKLGAALGAHQAAELNKAYEILTGKRAPDPETPAPAIVAPTPASPAAESNPAADAAAYGTGVRVLGQSLGLAAEAAARGEWKQAGMAVRTGAQAIGLAREGIDRLARGPVGDALRGLFPELGAKANTEKKTR